MPVTKPKCNRKQDYWKGCRKLAITHTTIPFFSYTPKSVPGPVLIKKFSDTSKAFMGILSSQAHESSTLALRWVSFTKGTKLWDQMSMYVCEEGGRNCHDWWASLRGVMCIWETIARAIFPRFIDGGGGFPLNKVQGALLEFRLYQKNSESQ